jgi:hypothetical protein
VLVIAAELLAKPLRQTPLRLIFFLLVATVACDALFRSPVAGRSLFSGNFLSGIRFYGIGNEYSALLTGAAVAALSPGWLCLFVLCALGLPYCGADAGGTIASTVAFGVQLQALRSRRFDLWQVAIAFVLASIVTVAFAILDRLQPVSARSHVGAALATGQTHGIGALVEIAARKIGMNVALAFTPWTLLAVAALIPVWLLLSRGAIGKRLVSALDKRPELRYAAIPASLWGALATAVFNDSGSVAGLLFLLPLTVTLLDVLLTDAIEQTGN